MLTNFVDPTSLSGDTLFLCRGYYIQRLDGTEYRLTDHDVYKDVQNFTGQFAKLNGLYLAQDAPIPSALVTDSDLSVDNMEIFGHVSSSLIEEVDIRAGLFDGAEVFVFIMDWSKATAADPPVYDVSTHGAIKLRRGTIGEVKQADTKWTFEVRGMTQPYTTVIGELFQNACTADFGDDRCKVQLLPPAWAATTVYSTRLNRDATAEKNTNPGIVKPTVYNDRWFIVQSGGTSGGSEPSWNLTLGATTPDSGVTWETIRAREVEATVDVVTNKKEFTITSSPTTDAPNAFLINGHAKFTSGANTGLGIEIKSWDLSTKKVITFLDFPYTIVNGDTLSLFAGCPKTVTGCKDASRDNIENHRGFPHVPRQPVFRSPPSF